MFKSLFSLILTAGKNISKNFFGRVMMGAGFGLVTISGLNAFVDYYKVRALEQFGELGAFSGLLGLAGIDKAVSIMIGAYVASVYIKTFGASVRAIKR
ncbi:DUF2523 family protein [Moraxella catarrhalis]|uniref:DUF2523 family protein n=1 Tax=Moraxella catarrhalis TaxID=480 RepID=UPI000EA992A6|nr:DUF2523 family protein [Moraxella catarrhalis]RKL73267.1 DUF2523 domain-containing protein [Moraxella catarrhalis]